jgi:uncharacterized membrane protein YhaH (DUF805 family)
MFCSKCGKENLDSNQFCGSCGQPLLVNEPHPSYPPTPQYQYQIPPIYPFYPQPVPSESAFSLYLGCFKKYAQFQGRARRSEYWFFCLFHMLAIFALTILGIAIMVPFARNPGFGKFLGLIVAGIYFVVGIIPSLSVLTRRLHDTGRSGTWAVFFAIGSIIPLINLIATIVHIVFTVQDSQPGTNQYGVSPKYPGPPIPVAYQWP